MRATLQVVSSPSRPRRIELRDGQAVRIGRSEWSDFPFPQDLALAEVHFAVACLPGGCFVRHLAEGLQTFVNGAPVQDARLRTGDRIAAGRTTFLVAVEGEEIVSRGETRSDASSSGESAAPATFLAADWIALAELLGLDPAAAETAQDGMTADDWIAALTDAKLFLPAARVRAHLLDRRAAVWWACHCLETEGTIERIPAGQRAAYETARAWVISPTETLRRQAESAAISLRNRGIGANLANAVFWSGSTLGPIESDPIPPDPTLTGTAITNALLLAAIEQSPKLAAERWPRFLNWGQSVADGKLPWPTTPATS